MEGVIELKKCRVCKDSKLKTFLSLGPIPLSNAFLKEEQLMEKEPFFPLDVCFCPNCGMVQLAQVVDPNVMFKDYAYFTGTSAPMKTHFDGTAKRIIEKFNLPEGSLVADIGSNDGILLGWFKQRKMRVLGIEPATNIAKIANENGIDTVNEFFGESSARSISLSKGRPMVMTATNVFAHVNDLDDFVRGIRHMLDDNGVFVIEVPYLMEMLRKVEFDTIYHEHLSYFAVRPLVTLFKRFDMSVIDVERIDVHGGSIRVYAVKGERKSSDSVEKLLKLEADAGLDKFQTYEKFAVQVKDVRRELVALLKDLKSKGKTIVGYGASAKGNILVNYCRIGTETLDYIADTTPFKQGLYSPGVHIPVVAFDRFYKEPPDYTLLLAWNYAEAILKKESSYRESGGKFILPVPVPEII
jgi:C-methyltransferase C-terminal domain/Putative zinc binding domain/Methyltransferase domain